MCLSRIGSGASPTYGLTAGFGGAAEGHIYANTTWVSEPYVDLTWEDMFNWIGDQIKDALIGDRL